MSNSQRTLIQTHGVTLGRALLGLLFVFSGVGMLMGGAEATAGYFTSLGVPAASLMFWLVIAIKIGAGASVMVGYRTGLAAGLLIVFTIFATLLAHRDLQDVNLFKNLSIIGGLLYAMAFGPGTGWKLGK